MYLFFLLFEKNVNAQEFFYEEVVEILVVNQISRYTKTSNKASATAIAGDYLDGTLIAKQTKTVTLTCSASGKLS